MNRVYFTSDTMAFLRNLACNNTKIWFTEHRFDYEAHVREPMLQFIADMQEPLSQISPHLRADPRAHGGSLFRVHADTRFHKGPPYKPWVSAKFFHERRRDVHSPSFFLQIRPNNSGFLGGGLWQPSSENLKKMRAFLVDNPAAWNAAVHTPAFEDRFSMWGQSLLRPPRGYAADHPLITDLKRKDFAAGERVTTALALSSELLPVVLDAYKALAPMMDYLCAALDLEF